jgi:hypothetical protein
MRERVEVDVPWMGQKCRAASLPGEVPFSFFLYVSIIVDGIVASG